MIKILSVQLSCDAQGCPTRIIRDSEAELISRAMQADWELILSAPPAGKHFCPRHARMQM